MHDKNDPKYISDKTRSIRLNSCGWYLGVLSSWMNDQMQENLNLLGLSLSQFAILMTLLEEEGLTQVEISKRVMLPGYATSRNLDRLESLGYVKRHCHETSRRALRIMLTEEGRALAPDLYRVTQGLNERFLAPLEENQKTELLDSLAFLAANLGLSSKG